MTPYPPANYLAKVTITDDNITEIEMLDYEKYLSYGMTEEDRNSYTAIQNEIAEDRIRSFGGISDIYEQFLEWNEESLKTLKKNQKINFEIKYNEKYSFPEYFEYGVYTYEYIGNNSWMSRDGEGSIIVEISDFTIIE